MAEWDKIIELYITKKRVTICQINEKNINNSFKMG